MNVIIVDDEPLALDVLETYIENVPEMHLVGKCTNALEANELIRKEDVDLLFLDIQMPQITGIEFLKSLANPPMVIFTTAYSNYALEGFELNALDYLLKPISLDRFMKAVNKALEQHDLMHNDGGTSASADEDFFFVKADKKLVKVRYKDILYIEGLKDYVIIRLEEGRVITLQTMKSLEEKLPASLFRRVHRSYIVALDKINALVGNMIELTEKGQAKHIPV
ncbi:MAG: LytTR family DNA-binding domain-containing protein, partial [Saprospiraceae bacterium]|nr:LytTR family DNA-binding domain-containing protein [Saprospiraceae bacterium]